jgi:hypothetical protein
MAPSLSAPSKHDSRVDAGPTGAGLPAGISGSNRYGQASAPRPLTLTSRTGAGPVLESGSVFVLVWWLIAKIKRSTRRCIELGGEVGKTPDKSSRLPSPASGDALPHRRSRAPPVLWMKEFSRLDRRACAARGEHRDAALLEKGNAHDNVLR